MEMKDYKFTEFKNQQDEIKSTLFRLKQEMENRSDTRDLNLDLLLMYQRRSGHLRGGGTEDNDDVKGKKHGNDMDNTTIEQYLHRQYTSSTESVTIKALSRIASWLLDVPLHPTATSLKESHRDSIEEVGSILSFEDDDDDETRSVYSYDNHDTISGSRFQTSWSGCADRSVITTQQQDDESTEQYVAGHGLSSQAEAYYALGAVYRHILAESTPKMNNNEMMLRRSDSLDDIDRLDYEITQMDIVRMNRIASRHLDVESIVRLPVLTYHQEEKSSSKKAVTTTTTIPTIPEDREPSITSSRPQSCDTDNATRGDDEEEQHETEFSWMLVPPISDDDSFGSASKNQYTGQNSDINSTHINERGRHPEDDLHDTDNDVCVICLESFLPGDRLRVLPCTHSFHVGCIDRWLSGSHSFYDCYTAGCPTCKVRPDAITTPHPTSSQSLPLPSQYSVMPPMPLHESDGSVPTWALARIGHILAQESQHF
jgi:hypothetical protein